MQSQKQPRKLTAMLWPILGLVCLGMLGCAYSDALTRDYGRSVHNNVAQQVINPRAGLKGEPPAVGLSPKAGENEMERYDKGFKGEAPPPTPYMGLTGAGK